MTLPPRRALLFAFWAAAFSVGVLALVPATTPTPSFGWDKANHAFAFAVLCALGVLCWPARMQRLLIALAAYGGAIEIAQTFTETRTGDWHDWLADLAGLAIVTAVIAARKSSAAPNSS